MARLAPVLCVAVAAAWLLASRAMPSQPAFRTAQAAGAAASVSTAGVVVAPVRLPDGVLFPGGVALDGPPPRPVQRGRYTEWSATYDLGARSEAETLDSVQHSVDVLGWAVLRGSHDVFAQRCAAARCELINARTVPQAGSAARTRLIVEYASRPA